MLNLAIKQDFPMDYSPSPSGPGRLEEYFRPLNSTEVKYAPQQVFFQGHLDLLSLHRRVSIIGSREASPDALRRTTKLAKILVEHAVVIVSGLAKGVDAAAHSAAIKNGGRTIGVLGTSLIESYPKENRELQAEMGRDHLLVTQFAESVATKPKNFPIRNRLMALISDATVIMAATDKSGTIHQGWEAIRLGRPLWIPESAVARKEDWSKAFLSYGANILSEDTISDLIDSLPVRDILDGDEFFSFDD